MRASKAISRILIGSLEKIISSLEKNFLSRLRKKFYML